MSGLAVIVAAGDRIRIEHQYLIGYAWIALIVLPPILVALAIMIQPWIVAADLRVGRPAAEMGQFFGDSFARRTGQAARDRGRRPDAGVAGRARRAEPARASIIGIRAATDRSHVDQRRTSRDKGAVIVWPATDSAGRAAARDRCGSFPIWRSRCRAAFAPADSRAACRCMRIGWGMIRAARARPTAPLDAQ